MYVCIYLSIHLSIYVSMYVCMYVSIYPSIHPSIDGGGGDGGRGRRGDDDDDTVFSCFFFLRVYPGSFKILVIDLQTSVILSLVLDFVWFCTFWIFLEVIFLAAGLHNHDQMFVT